MKCSVLVFALLGALLVSGDESPPACTAEQMKAGTVIYGFTDQFFDGGEHNNALWFYEMSGPNVDYTDFVKSTKLTRKSPSYDTNMESFIVRFIYELPDNNFLVMFHVDFDVRETKHQTNFGKTFLGVHKYRGGSYSLHLAHLDAITELPFSEYESIHNERDFKAVLLDDLIHVSNGSCIYIFRADEKRIVYDGTDGCAENIFKKNKFWPVVDHCSGELIDGNTDSDMKIMQKYNEWSIQSDGKNSDFVANGQSCRFLESTGTVKMGASNWVGFTHNFIKVHGLMHSYKNCESFVYPLPYNKADYDENKEKKKRRQESQGGETEVFYDDLE